MVVEDEVLVAAELEWMVEDFGHISVGSAVCREEAVALAAARRPELAFVDLCLADGATGIETACALMEKGVIVYFMTANPKRLPEDLAGAAGVIAKPYAPGAVRYALEHAAARLNSSGDPLRSRGAEGDANASA